MLILRPGLREVCGRHDMHMLHQPNMGEAGIQFCEGQLVQLFDNRYNLIQSLGDKLDRIRDPKATRRVRTC